MKSLIFVVSFVLIIMSVRAQEGEKKNAYGSNFGDFDVDAVLGNGRVLQNYVKCLIGEGSCTKEGRELKKIMPEAIRTECSKCDEKQKAATVKVLKFLDEKHPELLKKLMDKFDPDRVYERKIRERIARAETEKKKTEQKTTATTI